MNLSGCSEKDRKRRREAYTRTHEIRSFEIGPLWQRATYYRAVILAPFTAHFGLPPAL